MNSSDFQKLSAIRLEEARRLLRSKHYAGAYYLAGYSIECALKACIAAKTKAAEFPPKPDIVRDYYKHDLIALVRAAELKDSWRLSVRHQEDLKRIGMSLDTGQNRLDMRLT